MTYTRQYFQTDNSDDGQVRNVSHWGVEESGLRSLHLEPVVAGRQDRLDGTGVKIALLDGAADLSHQGFRPAHTHTGYDFITDGQAGELPAKELKHGTAVAGVIAADGRKKEGAMHGVSPGVQLHCFRVVRRGRIQDYALEKSLVCAMEAGVDIINISLQNFPRDPKFYSLLQEAWYMGVILVAQAGNGAASYRGVIESPAAFPEVIAVSGHKQGCAAATRGRSRFLDFTAPGDGIYTLGPYNGQNYTSGSSYASPFVAGLMALIIQIWRARFGQTPDQETVWKVLRHSTHTHSFHTAYGYGKIIPRKAIDFARHCDQLLPEKEPELVY